MCVRFRVRVRVRVRVRACVCVQGFFLTRTAYLRNGWNVVDFAILVLSSLDLVGITEGGWVREEERSNSSSLIQSLSFKLSHSSSLFHTL